MPSSDTYSASSPLPDPGLKSRAALVEKGLTHAEMAASDDLVRRTGAWLRNAAESTG